MVKPLLLHVGCGNLFDFRFAKLEHMIFYLSRIPIFCFLCASHGFPIEACFFVSFLSPLVVCLLQGLSRKPVVAGLVEQLQKIFPSEPFLEVESAVNDGLARAMEDEDLEVAEVTCIRDYAKLCPEGAVFALLRGSFRWISDAVRGWADAGDGDACLVP